MTKSSKSYYNYFQTVLISSHASATPTWIWYGPWTQLLRQNENGIYNGIVCGNGLRCSVWWIRITQVTSSVCVDGWGMDKLSTTFKERYTVATCRIT